MTTSKTGIELIKRYEGLRLEAYKATPKERYYTIGYGHYGSDVRAGQKITPEEAEMLLKMDLYICEDAVSQLPYKLSQPQFDALVSFTYNCGVGGLKQLTADGTRTIGEIADKMLLYVKSGGVALEGLKRRRKAEHDLFLTADTNDIKDLQIFLNDHGADLVVDGIAGRLTRAAIRDFLSRAKINL